jgi:hypothetical protein
MIIASAAFYGILPKAAAFVGLVGVADFIYGLQATGVCCGLEHVGWPAPHHATPHHTTPHHTPRARLCTLHRCTFTTHHKHTTHAAL